MTAYVSLLRGVNVGGRNMVKMRALCEMYGSLGLRDAITYVNSGNVAFRSDEADRSALISLLQRSIDDNFGFRCDLVLRTAAELRDVISRNPFAGRPEVEPEKLLVVFLAHDPDPAGCAKVAALEIAPEEIVIDGRELFIYYANGMARPKLTWPILERNLRVTGTGRNWNTVERLLEMVERLELSGSA